jgi:hypothetical protein
VTPEIASLLLRQHAALMDEGIGPEDGVPGDRETIEEAWALVQALQVAPLRFTLHWGHEYGFVPASAHYAHCDCSAALIYRGVLTWCRGCQRHEPNPHQCRADYAVTWLAQK